MLTVFRFQPLTTRARLGFLWSRRPGSTLVELAAAAFIAGLLAMIAVQFLGTAAKTRRSVELRDMALQEASNILELCTSVSFDEVTDEMVAELRESEDTVTSSPARRMQITLTEFRDPRTKKITVEINWPKIDRVAPVRLTAWKYPVLLKE